MEAEAVQAGWNKSVEKQKARHWSEAPVLNLLTTILYFAYWQQTKPGSKRNFPHSCYANIDLNIRYSSL